jgi:AcrR family transcriptional regulator
MSAQSAEQLLQLDTLSETEQRILLGALHCFIQQGYFNTRIPDIVAASGVSTGSIYHHFKDKQHLAEALITQLINGLDRAMAQLISQHETPMRQIRALIEWMLTLTDAEPALVSFILYARHREFLPHQPPLCTQQPFEQMRRLVVRARQNGDLPPLDEMVLAAAVFGPALRIMQAAVDGVLPRPAQAYSPELFAAIERLSTASAEV